MRFTLDHQRSAIGNDLTASIDAEGDEAISGVTISYDRFDLARESFDPPTQSYQREFRQQGGAAPGMEHTLVVTATDASGQSQSAISEWADET